MSDKQFGDINIDSHAERLKMIKSLSKKQYLDDGPVALVYCIQAAKDKGFNGIVEFALRELEKLYNINGS